MLFKDSVASGLFGKAMAEQLGIDPKRVMLVTVEGRPGSLLTAQLTVKINADDLAAVAERMRAAPRANPIPMPSPRS